MDISPTFFTSAAEFRAWFEANHDKVAELWVGYYKKGTGRPSITWPESVDQALCFGWIDGVRKGIDDATYMIRFTPRKPGSTWSAVNIKRMQELMAQGLVQTAGRTAFGNRTEEKSAIYSYEQRKEAELDAAEEEQFRANEQAWAFFQAQPASYRKAAYWWVISAKRPETRTKRLVQLIVDSERGKTVPPLTRRVRAE